MPEGTQDTNISSSFLSQTLLKQVESKGLEVKERFVNLFENATIEQKKDSITQLYNAIVDIYNISYRGNPIPLIFSNGEGYAFNHDGFIRIPLDVLESQTSDKAVYSLFHESRHAMQPVLNIKSDGMGLPALSTLSHDMRNEEIDAIKFAFANMDGLGFDKTKIDRYDELQKAIRITDTFDSLKQNYNQETANNMLDIYKLLDEHTFQTTRSDFSTARLLKSKITFNHNISEAKAKVKILSKLARSTNDTFLLNTVSNIKADWPRYNL